MTKKSEIFEKRKKKFRKPQMATVYIRRKMKSFKLKETLPLSRSFLSTFG
jgi:hypothetical protein